MGAKSKLSDSVLYQLRQDFAERRKIRKGMSAHTYSILTLELGFSKQTIIRIERDGYSPEKFPRVPEMIGLEIERRRKIYRMLQEVYKAKYTVPAMMARYGVSKPTIRRRQLEFYAMQRDELRMAA